MNGIKSFIVDVSSLIRDHGLLMVLFLIAQFSISTIAIHMYVKDVFCLVTIFSIYNKYRNVNNLGLLFFFCVINYLLMLSGKVINSQFEMFSLLIGPIAYYIFGYHTMNNIRSCKDFDVFLLLTIVSSSFMLWYNNIVDSEEVGFLNVTRAVLNDAGIEEQSATLQGMLAAIAISGLSYPISHQRLISVKSLLFFVSGLLSLFCVLHLINRSGLIILCVVVSLSLLYNKKIRVSYILLWGIFFFIVYSILVHYNEINDNITSAYKDRDDMEGQSVNSAGGRFVIWTKSLKLMWEYPYGWVNTKISGYCHNLWLDVARCVGIFPAFILVIYSLRNYYNVYILFKIKNNYINCVFVCVNISLFLAAFVEPVLEAISTFFYLMCMYWGMQQAYINRRFKIE